MQENPGCVFCDRAQFEKQLIGETPDFWIIATLGQITDGGYVLLVPKRHVSCIGAMEESEIELLESVVDRVMGALLVEYNAPVIFEHGIVGQTIKHAHIHFVPQVCNVTDRVLADFPGSKITRPMKYDPGYRENWQKLRDQYARKQKPYLLWNDGYISRMSGMKVCWNPEAPPQYLRIVVAEELGRPERANWRSMDPELDKRLWQETVARLKPYFQRP